jgi:hypothetical protein
VPSKQPRHEPLTPALRFFFEAVERGRCLGARPQDAAARDVVLIVAARLEDASLLEGLIEFSRLAQQDPQRARALAGL